jgi:Transposase DDE domain
MDDLDLDWDEAFAGLHEDWEVIESVLPAGWQDAARRTGALMRTRGFDSPATLLRVLLIHLVEGCSLRETAVRANAGGLASVSDVALLGRLRGSGEWFRWMVEQMSRRLSEASQEVLPGKRVRLADATVVCEPGATGSTWRLHYVIDLTTLACEQVQVTLPDEGETLTRFAVQRGDVLMADRGLAHRRGIRHVVQHGGDVVVRMNLVSVPLEDAQGREFRLLPRLRKLSIGQAQSWSAVMRDDNGAIDVRVCALKKSAEQTRTAQEKLRQVATKKGRALQPDTLEAAGYVVVLTTLSDVPARQILELYRYRWQIELAFKRLKSLLHLGHLKKTDPVGAKAWLQGKLFVATLIETLIAVGERFSPWGYVLAEGRPAPLPMA